MKNVIVTGGTGFLGRNMIRKLCDEGYRVYAVVRPDSKNAGRLPKHENVIPVRCTLDTVNDVTELQGRDFEAFYHFAWGGVNRNEIDDVSVHQESMRDSLSTVNAAIDLGCRCYIFSGSRSEYGNLKGLFSEDANCHPLVAYGRAKLDFGNQARRICKTSNMRFIHGRIFSVYGFDDHPWSLIYTAVNKMLRDEDMDLSSCTQLWNFMDVRDMADLLLTFQENCNKIPSDDSGIFNVATSDVRVLRDFVDEIYRITNSRSKLRFGSFQQADESALSIIPDMRKVETIFGWKPKISFADGIQHMIERMEVQHA